MIQENRSGGKQHSSACDYSDTANIFYLTESLLRLVLLPSETKLDVVD